MGSLSFPLSNSVEPKRKQTKGYYFSRESLSLQVFLYGNTLKVAVMQFRKERSYFGALGEQ